MLNGNGASVNCNTTKNCSDTSLIYSTTFAVIERSIAIATIVRIVFVTGRISVEKRIPGPLHARTDVNFHFDFSSLVEQIGRASCRERVEIWVGGDSEELQMITGSDIDT